MNYNGYELPIDKEHAYVLQGRFWCPSRSKGSHFKAFLLLSEIFGVFPLSANDALDTFMVDKWTIYVSKRLMMSTLLSIYVDLQGHELLIDKSHCAEYSEFVLTLTYNL